MASEGPVEDAGASDVPKEPSFQGRLHLKDFMFVSNSDSKSSSNGTTPSSSPAAMRRSSRNTASPLAGGLLPLPSSSAPLASPPGRAPRTRKRKAEDSEESATATRVSTTAAAAKNNIPSAFFPPSSSSPSPTKRGGRKGRAGAGYAPPSTYAHLSLLPDAVAPGLLILFIGLNPGVETARTGHAYAHPTNLFWRLLYSSGITPVPCTAREDREMPRRYGLRFTNIVARPSRSGSELSHAEMDDGVADLHRKCARWRPEVARMGVVEDEGAVSEGGAGRWPGSRVFVATSTSGLAASLRPEEKERIWKELGDWCVARRKEKEEGKGEEKGEGKRDEEEKEARPSC